MSEELIDKLQLDSSFYGDGFKFIIKKVYKYNNKVNGDGCKTKEDGYCFLFEPREVEG